MEIENFIGRKTDCPYDHVNCDHDCSECLNDNTIGNHEYRPYGIAMIRAKFKCSNCGKVLSESTRELEDLKDEIYDAGDDYESTRHYDKISTTITLNCPGCNQSIEMGYKATVELDDQGAYCGAKHST